MIYLKLVDRTRDGWEAIEYLQFSDDCVNIASVICNFALDRQISPRHILCQVYKGKDWREERDDQRKAMFGGE